MRRTIAGTICGATLASVPTVLPIVWPTVPPPVGYAILAGLLVIAAASAAFAFWPPPKIIRDKPLGEALAYACFRQWGRRFFDAAGTQGAGVDQELERSHQLARDGRIAVWGKEKHHTPYVQLAPEYWSNHDVEWFSLLRGEDNSEVVGSQSTGHHALMVSRTQFEKEWPKMKFAALPWLRFQTLSRQGR